MAHQAGFDNVVASLGTALTPGQVALLTRYASRIALAYDVDAAGEKAGTLGVTALAGLIGQLQGDTSGVKLEDVRVARLPDGKDPDDVVRESPAVWETAIAKAKPLVEYLIDHHAGRFDLKTSSGRIGFVEAVMPAIRDIADPLRRDEALGEVRRVSGVEERVLRQVLERPARNPIAGAGVRRQPRTASRGSAPTRSCRRRTRCRSTTSCGRSRRSSRSCSGSSCSSPTSSSGSSSELGPDQLPSTVARELFRAIVAPARAERRRASTRRSIGAAPAARARRRNGALADGRCMPSRGPIPEPRCRAGSTTRSTVSSSSSRTTSCASAATTTKPPRRRPNGPAIATTIDRLMLERRQINEARLSLDRRRDQTRLLASHRR